MRRATMTTRRLGWSRTGTPRWPASAQSEASRMRAQPTHSTGGGGLRFHRKPRCLRLSQRGALCRRFSLPITVLIYSRLLH